MTPDDLAALKRSAVHIEHYYGSIQRVAEALEAMARAGVFGDDCG